MSRGLNARAALWLAFALGMGNDFLFVQVSGTQALYVCDYIVKASVLACFCAARGVPAPPQPIKLRPLAWLAWFVFLVGLALSFAPLRDVIGRGWRLFRWPAIEDDVLFWFDVTIGLALTALAEELIYRRLAFAVLAPRHAVLFSSVGFGLIHWGEGYHAILAGALTGLALGWAYRRTGSLLLVIAAHYAMDLWFFFGSYLLWTAHWALYLIVLAIWWLFALPR